MERQIIDRMVEPSNPSAFETTRPLRRGLFGIRRKDLLRELERRRFVLDASRDRERAAGAEAERLRENMEALRGQIEIAHRELDEIRAGSSTDPQASGGHSKFCDCPPSEALLQDMTKIVSLTEESTQKILENARTTLLRDIDAAEALREQARSEIAQAVAWRSHWGPAVRAFQKTIREAQGAIEGIPERIRDALAPLTAAAAALDHELLQFSTFGDSLKTVVVGEADGTTIDVSDEGSASEAHEEAVVPAS
jgi:hypothetical protein